MHCTTRRCLAALGSFLISGLVVVGDSVSDEQCSSSHEEIHEGCSSLLQSNFPKAAETLTIPSIWAVPSALTPAKLIPLPAAKPAAMVTALPLSNCYKDPWMDEMVRMDPDGDGKVFVDVGCNTGSDAVMWLERWGRTAGVANLWDQGLRKSGVAEGACGQNVFHGVSRLGVKRSNASRGGPRVLCVEPVPRTAKMLLTLTTEIFGTNTSFEVVHAAASDQITNGTLLFPDVEVGIEDSGINGAGSLSKLVAQVPVPQVTVDQLLTKHGFKTVDVLTIDTEGHDPLVIQGAATAFRNGMVRFLVFEVHQDLVNTAWAKTPLNTVLQSFEAWQYDCYLTDNAGKLHRLSGVWNAEMEKKYYPIGWSNVACVRKSDKW